MKKEEIKKFLNDLFVPRSEGFCFNNEYMRKGNEAYPVYEAVSSAMHASGLSFNFSYEIASRAVDILVNLEDEGEGVLYELIDNAIPIYTSDIMEIYNANSWVVDEAFQEFGGNEQNSEERAKQGWYHAIENMVEAIQTNLKEIKE